MHFLLLGSRSSTSIPGTLLGYTSIQKVGFRCQTFLKVHTAYSVLKSLEGEAEGMLDCAICFSPCIDLCNGTRVIVTRLGDHVVEAMVLIGTNIRFLAYVSSMYFHSIRYACSEVVVPMFTRPVGTQLEV